MARGRDRCPDGRPMIRALLDSDSAETGRDRHHHRASRSHRQDSRSPMQRRPPPPRSTRLTQASSSTDHPPRRAPGNAAVRPRQLGTFALVAILLSLVVTGCAQHATSATHPVDHLRQLACIGRCQDVQEQCNAQARFDYRQCQAGYSAAFRDYRWCLASTFERSDCGYAWWPCAENRFGNCANQAADCEQACRRALTP